MSVTKAIILLKSRFNLLCLFPQICMHSFIYLFILASLYQLITLTQTSATPKVINCKRERNRCFSHLVQEAVVAKVSSGVESGCSKWKAERAKFEQSSIGLRGVERAQRVQTGRKAGATLGNERKGNIDFFFSSSHLAICEWRQIRDEQGVEMSGSVRTCSDLDSQPFS